MACPITSHRSLSITMFLHVLRVIFILLEVLVLFNLLIVVHELGPFPGGALARALHRKIRRLVRQTALEENDQRRAVFVRLASVRRICRAAAARADGHHRGRKPISIGRKLPPISALDKIIVAVAGPLFSLLLALVFAASSGPSAIRWANRIMTTVIGYVVPGFAAAKGRAATRAIRFSKWMENRSRVFWDERQRDLERGPQRRRHDPVEVRARRAKYLRSRWSPTRRRRAAGGGKSVRQVLIYPARTPIIDEVEPDYARGRGGFAAGRHHPRIQRHAIYNPIALADYIEQTSERGRLTLDVERGGSTLR